MRAVEGGWGSKNATPERQAPVQKVSLSALPVALDGCRHKEIESRCKSALPGQKEKVLKGVGGVMVGGMVRGKLFPSGFRLEEETVFSSVRNPMERKRVYSTK